MPEDTAPTQDLPTEPRTEVLLTNSPVNLHPSLLSQGLKEIFVWESPERLYRPKDLNWILNSILLLLLVVAVLLFIREFILIAVVLAITFLVYVLSTVPPREVDHKITNQGIRVGEHSYLWEELVEFWLEEKDGHDLLVVETALRFPPRLIILLGELDPNEVKNYLVNYIPFREKPTHNWVEGLSKRVEKKLSL